MKAKLKPIREQVVVLVGASSGIGRQAAIDFARRGAKVVVAARDEEGLRDRAKTNSQLRLDCVVPRGQRLMPPHA